jgi:predicted RNase H-like HicB family nuclease
MTETFTAVVWKEGEWYVAQCREFEVASQGETKEEALDNPSEALSVHFSVPMAQ